MMDAGALAESGVYSNVVPSETPREARCKERRTVHERSDP
jgi:hypothetical protein